MIADDEVRAEYEARMREIYDYNSAVTNAEKKAEAKANAEKRESVKKMLLKGLDVSDIADIIGISIEEINEIKKKIQ